MLRRRELMASRKVRLPTEYREVAYLESSGSQRISFGFPASKVGRWELTAKFLAITSNQLNGCFYNDTNTAIDIGIYNGKFFMRNGAVNTVTKTADTEKHVFVVDQLTKQCLIDGEIVSTSYSTLGKNDAYPQLFARNVQAGPDYYNITFLCYEKLYESIVIDVKGIKVSHRIPCYRKTDQKPGLYDIVTNVFHINQMSGSDFTVGPDVT